MTRFVVATAQYPVSRPSSWDEVEQATSSWMATAAERGASLLVFPEYAAMTLAALLPAREQGDLAAQLAGLQPLRMRYLALHRQLARQHGIYLLAGSFPWELAPGYYCNRAWFCGPGGELGFQDKQVMTRFEREHWRISRGEPTRVFDTALGRIGIAICYDAEFPLLVRGQIEAGAEILLVPSCTDALPGYHRVRVGAQARALEGQCYVVTSPLVGEAPWSPAIDTNVGAAGVYGPPDLGFPEDGVISQGTINEPGWIFADIDRDRVAEVRRAGQVFNHGHWPESVGTAPVACVQL